MQNPILQMLNINPTMNKISTLKNMISGNPQAIFDGLMQSNSKFREFITANQGKTPDQIAKEHGIDLSQILK